MLARLRRYLCEHRLGQVQLVRTNEAPQQKARLGKFRQVIVEQA